MPVDDVDNAEAARIATLLRQHADIELYTPPTHNLSQALAQAAKRNTPFVIIVGAAERAGNYLSVRDMRAETQFTSPLDDLTSLIEKLTHD